jgi:hypothetical protein
MWEKGSYGEVIYMGNVQEPQKINNTCMKTMHVRTMDIEVSLYQGLYYST